MQVMQGDEGMWQRLVREGTSRLNSQLTLTNVIPENYGPFINTLEPPMRMSQNRGVTPIRYTAAINAEH